MRMHGRGLLKAAGQARPLRGQQCWASKAQRRARCVTGEKGQCLRLHCSPLLLNNQRADAAIRRLGVPLCPGSPEPGPAGGQRGKSTIAYNKLLFNYRRLYHKFDHGNHPILGWFLQLGANWLIHARTELVFQDPGTGWIPPSPLVQFKLYQGEVLPYNPSTRDWVIHPVRDPSSTNSVRAWYMLYSMNAPFGRTRVTRGWNRDLVLYDHTFSNLSGMERECARTVRSSSKVSKSIPHFSN